MLNQCVANSKKFRIQGNRSRYWCLHSVGTAWAFSGIEIVAIRSTWIHCGHNSLRALGGRTPSEHFGTTKRKKSICRSSIAPISNPWNRTSCRPHSRQAFGRSDAKRNRDLIPRSLDSGNGDELWLRRYDYECKGVCENSEPGGHYYRDELTPRTSNGWRKRCALPFFYEQRVALYEAHSLVQAKLVLLAGE